MVIVQEADFDGAALTAALRASAGPGVGGIVTFVGYVRDYAPDTPTDTLYLEHYPGMCERELEDIAATARARWNLDGTVIVHRVGALARNAQIVFVAAASAHRGDAFAAANSSSTRSRPARPSGSARPWRVATASGWNSANPTRTARSPGTPNPAPKETP